MQHKTTQVDGRRVKKNKQESGRSAQEYFNVCGWAEDRDAERILLKGVLVCSRPRASQLMNSSIYTVDAPFLGVGGLDLMLLSIGAAADRVWFTCFLGVARAVDRDAR